MDNCLLFFGLLTSYMSFSVPRYVDIVYGFLYVYLYRFFTALMGDIGVLCWLGRLLFL